MPANQLITKPREEVDLTLTVTDGDVMPYTYHLHDVFSEVISLINQCKNKGIMFRFRATMILIPIRQQPAWWLSTRR